MHNFVHLIHVSADSLYIKWIPKIMNRLIHTLAGAAQSQGISLDIAVIPVMPPYNYNYNNWNRFYR